MTALIHLSHIILGLSVDLAIIDLINNIAERINIDINIILGTKAESFVKLFVFISPKIDNSISKREVIISTVFKANPPFIIICSML